MEPFWHLKSIPNFVLQPGIVIGAPFGRPSGNEGLGKDHVEEFLETFCAFGGLQNGVAKHFFGELLWDVRAKNARARA